MSDEEKPRRFGGRKKGQTYDTRLDIPGQIKMAKWMEANKDALEELNYPQIAAQATAYMGRTISESTVSQIRKALEWPPRRVHGKIKEPSKRSKEQAVSDRLEIVENVLLKLSEFAVLGGWTPPECRKKLIENIEARTKPAAE